jgi:uncharacterized membrane protein
MDPVSVVTDAVDKTEEFLGHSPHPAIVGLPIGAWAVSNVCDVMALMTGDRPYDHAARLSMGIGLVGAAGAVVTGLRDYSFIPKDRQPNHDIATRHALGNAVAGSLFAASYLLRARDYQAGREASALARLLGLAGGGLVLYTAWLGGKLVEELGEAVKPVMEQQEQQEQEHEEGQKQVTESHHDGHRKGRKRRGARSHRR